MNFTMGLPIIAVPPTILRNRAKNERNHLWVLKFLDFIMSKHIGAPFPTKFGCLSNPLDFAYLESGNHEKSV